MLLSCNITGGTSLTWSYNSDVIGGQVTLANGLPSTNPDVVGGVEFTLTLLMPTSPHLVSHLSYTASDSVNGRTVECLGEAVGAAEEFPPPESITLQVETISK